MAIKKPYAPGAAVYDGLRTALQGSDGGLFHTLMNTPIRAGQPLGPWKGLALTSYSFSALRGLTHKHYTVRFNTAAAGYSQWFVNLEGDTTQEERNRLAQVFMDLINSQRIDN